MKFFNIDLHISVIEDLARILRDLGHSVTSWNMSGHNWVFGRQAATTSVVSQGNWTQLDQAMCDRFYATYRHELESYDAFITTHPPCFSWLFDKWNKPIIAVASIRYEVPFSHSPDTWNRFNDYLVTGIDNGMIIPIANNKYDAAYAEYFTGRRWTHVPSLCEYTKATYHPIDDRFLYYSRLSLAEVPVLGQTSNIVDRNNALPTPYKWSDLGRHAGIVCVPYNISTMSMFEFYTQNIPMFFPTLTFMKSLRGAHPSAVLCETTWNQIFGLRSESAICSGPSDPNDFQDIDKVMKWLPLADFYDSEWMPHLQYFGSWAELKDRLREIRKAELFEISNKMENANRERRVAVYDLWRQATTRVADRLLT